MDGCIYVVYLSVCADILKRNMSKYSDMELPASEPEPVQGEDEEVISSCVTCIYALCEFAFLPKIAPDLKVYPIPS